MENNSGNMKVPTKCLFGFHNYEVYKEEDMTDKDGNKVGHVIINRCKHCGHIKVINVFTVVGAEYRR